jgi:Tfp pilus assembly protein PilN
MNGSHIALTITPEDLKYAEISTLRGQSVMRSCHQSSFFRSDTEAPGLIQKVIQDKKPLTSKALLILSSRDIAYREFLFPFSSAKKVGSAIRFEISSEYPPEDFIIDYVESIPREPGKKAFLVAVAKRETVRKRIKAAEEAGLHILGITSDLSTLGNYFMDESEALIMDTGQSHTLFSLFLHGVPLFVRDIPIGTSQIRGELKKSEDRSLRSLTGEIKRTVLSFNTKAGQTLNKVHISGNILLEPIVYQALKKNSDIEFLEEKPQGSGIQAGEPGQPANAFASLLGAAWWKRGKSFNFLKEEFAASEADATAQSYFKWATILAGAVFFAFLSSSLFNLFALDKREAFLTKEVRKTYTETFPDSRRIVDEVKQARNALNARLSDLGDHNPSIKASVLDILETLSITIPRQTKFEIMNLFWEKGKVEIGGRTDSFKSVNAIQEMLNNTGHFTDVTISNAKSRDDGQVVEFTLTIRFEG